MKWGREIVIAAVAAGTLLTANTVSAQRSSPLDPNGTINVPFTYQNLDTGTVVHAGGAQATSAPIQTDSAMANRDANLRSGPGTNHPVVDYAQAGQVLTPIGQSADGYWLLLDSDAWIATFLVDGELDGLPVVGASATSNSGSSTATAPQSIADLDPATAVEVMTVAIAQDPNDAIAYVLRAAAYTDLGDLVKAQADLDRALQLNPGLAQAYNLRGRIHHERGNYAYAVNDFSYAIQIEPSGDAYRDRGAAHQAMGNYAEALANYNKAVQLDPGNAANYYNRAVLYQFSLKNDDMAIQDWGKVIELSPSTLAAYNNRGLLLTQHGEHAAALADMAAYAAHAENGLPPHVLDTRGYIYLRQGNLAAAIADYEAALDAGFDSVYTVLGYGIALAESGNMEKGLPLLLTGLAYVQDGGVSSIDGQLADLIQWAQTSVRNAQ